MIRLGSIGRLLQPEKPKSGRGHPEPYKGFTVDVRGMHIVYHNGKNPGFRAAIVLVPSFDASVVVLTNGESNRFIDAATRNLLEKLFQ